jgi:hypothetical protein
MTPRRLLYIFLGVITVLRLIYITQVELLPDETYYFMWSQRMDFCYYSKGPGVAAVIWLGTHLFGANEFGVRFFSPLLALGTSLLMASFARRLYGESVALWTILVLNCIPIFQVGSLVMTIDPLSIFFWMAALYTFWLALEQSPKVSKFWPATGALMGLGFLSKYTNAMQLVSIVLLLAFTPKYRKELGRRGFWIMLGVFILFTLPPVIWNSQHEWITVAHLTVRGHLEKAFKLDFREFLKFIVLHFGVYSPLIFGAMLAAFWWGIDKGRMHFKPRFLLWFAAPLFVLYSWVALRGANEPNWTAPASLSLGLLTVAIWHEMAQQRQLARQFAICALALGVVISAVALDADLLRAVGVPLSYDSDPGQRVRGWKTTAEMVENFRRDFEIKSGGTVFLIANSYQMASELAFYMQDKRPAAPGHPPVYIPESQNIENQYSFWPRYDEVTDLAEVARDYLAGPPEAGANPQLREGVVKALAALPEGEKADPAAVADAKRALVHALHLAAPNLPLDESFVEEQGPNLFSGHTALYISDRGEDRAPSTIQQGFEHSEMIACIDIKRRGLPLRQLRIFECRGYRGMPL